jgi:hypothetical protein
MTKRKRTVEEVIAKQTKAVRFQLNLGHHDAALSLESLTASEYAQLRKIQIVSEPVQKRRRRQMLSQEDRFDDVPVGYVRIIEETVWEEQISKGGVRRHRVVVTDLKPRSSNTK